MPDAQARESILRKSEQIVKAFLVVIPWYRTPSRTFDTIHSSADERPAMRRYLTDQSNTFTATRVLVKPAIGNPEMSLVKAYPALTYQHVVGFGAGAMQ